MFLKSILVVVLFSVQSIRGSKRESYRDVATHVQRSALMTSRLAPPFNENGTVHVQFGLSLVNIKSFDPETGDAEFLFWDKFSWSDPALAWDPAAHGGIDQVKVPVSSLWTPDLRTYNSLDACEEKHVGDVLAIVTSDGSVMYIPPKSRTVRCDAASNDTHVFCKVKVGSWTFNGFEMDLTFFAGMEHVDDGDYLGEHELVENSAGRDVMHYDCCEEPYISLRFEMTFKKPSA